uniref:[histone H3]-trimethyl-L-lysine(4) demethylase n=1 Tax=Haemonchus contortus TaxID=6289 RepID=A0A7I5EAT7_HAECO
MENLDRFYRYFERPPFAPIYYPTAEEFLDPLAYVAKIRPEAEQYGVVKIVPPESFKPPFAINSETFEFTPRIQKLNEVEAIVRERQVFLEKITTFWRLQGFEFKNLVIDGKNVDLFKLYKVVKSLGGASTVTSKKQWTQASRKVNVRSNHGTSNLKAYYLKFMQPFVSVLESTPPAEEDPQSDTDTKCREEDCQPTMQGRRRAARPKGRMMAGLPQPKRSKVTTSKKKADPMESVFCSVCGSGDDEDRLLLCEDCDKSIHTHCCDPPLAGVPKGEWRCPSCVAKEVSKIGLNYGFYDAHVKYNLFTFAEYANKFKTDYFGVKEPEDVPDDAVEREFWRIVFDTEETVSVKYGADLITSKVGSGFPRKGDDHRGIDAKQKHLYANHAWNLNNLPVLKESVLSHIETGISGMMVPWVYVGMCFSTFCWHTEDHWTYSINYNHWGERKIWYGIGGENASMFEETVRKLAPGATVQKDIFHHMTTAVNPAILISMGVKIWTVHQNAGEFVITFPRAYHAGYNEGLNFAEAVNFAPIDWLSKGRKCIAEYADVRRFCVFSHDELVLKMASSCEKLGIAMSLATLDEMLEIAKRETQHRTRVVNHGVSLSQRENFESIADDARVCRYCNTTVFLSALICSHGKTVCLEHIDHLCSKCPPSECTLKYRYTVEELGEIVHKLEERTTLYFDWKEQVDSLLNDSHSKPSLSAVESLLETARHKRFPHTSPLVKLQDISKVCHAAAEKARTLLNGKIRTRVKTRIQRADTRLDLGGIHDFIDELRNLPCDQQNLVHELEELIKKIEAWQTEASDAIKKCTDDDALLTSSSLRALAEQGEDFDVRLDEVDQLWRTIEMREWNDNAKYVLEWTTAEGIEESDDFLTIKRWKPDEVLRLVSDGARLFPNGGPSSPVNRLHSLLKSALLDESKVELLLADSTANEKDLENVWKEIRESDWLDTKIMSTMREEIVRLYAVQQRAQQEEVSLNETMDLIKECESSKFLTNSGLYDSLLDVKDSLLNFTQRLVNLFQKPASYYNLVEIIRDRDDLAALVEGQSLPRYLNEDLAPEEQWLQLSEFGSSAEMKQHLCSLRAQSRALIGSLQLINTQRNVADTCVCASPGNPDADLLVCILCRAKYHGMCCEWDPFLDRLPECTYLCVRCLRGRRPCIEDVQAACNLAPQNSLEFALVREMICRGRELSSNAKSLLSNIGDEDELSIELEERAQTVVESVLACEVLDMDILPKVVSIIQKTCSDILAQQKRAWMEMRNRPARSSPLPSLFVRQKRGKRNSGKHSAKKERKRSRVVYHQDDEQCSADTCLKPYGETVGWILCEAGCARWYHYVCIGMTAESAKSLPSYICYRCSGTVQQIAQHPVAV